jgi:ATP-dependent DNA helicase RecG
MTSDSPPDDPLAKPAQFSRGVGPNRAKLLEKLGIETVGDLIVHLPRDVLDLTDVRAVHELVEKETQSILGTVVDRDSRITSTGKTMTAVLFQADTGFIRGVWFNQSYMLAKFQDGQRVVLSGKPKFRDRRWEFSHPHVQWLGDDDDERGGGVLPKYGLTEGLRQHELRRIIRYAVEDAVEFVVDTWPDALRERLQVPSLAEGLRLLHMPRTMDEYHLGRRRVLLGEILEFQIGMALRQRYWRKSHISRPIEVSAKVDARIRRLFPFQLTAGQNETIREVTADLARNSSMHRLLQADVGAGKTAIAVYGMLAAIAAGGQAVLLAPTEVLARQHWQTIDDLLAESRVERRLLVGDQLAFERREILEGLASGRVQLAVGTQALIQDRVRFANLQFAVIDEQHKFGVRQRASFSTTEGFSPHVLVMTATPIPRSLCLTQFGDLSLSTIKELPPGRAKVITARIRGPGARRKMWNHVRQQLDAGRQVYVVCPRVGETPDDDEVPLNEPDDTPAAESVYATLSKGELRDYRVGLVHGRLPRELKQQAMDDFRDGETQVLVSTTVIEVGVDVANASIMVIQQAERFGLSQLHQLRGRIGRGRHVGYCFALSEADTPEAAKRLNAFESISDGFQLAEVDLEIRGAGDVLGVRQSGSLPFQHADPARDKELFEETHAVAQQLVDRGDIDEPEYAMLKVAVLERFGALMELPHTG